jgi:N-acetylmuramoyl-L-alanine amidase
MPPAASRLSLAAVFLLSAAIVAAEPAGRAAPSRPGVAAAAPTPAPSPAAPAVPFRKISGIDYVKVEDVASALSLKLSWIERGKKLALAGSGTRVELVRDSREITANGLRVFLGDPTVDTGGTIHVSRIDFERCLTPLLRPGFGVAPRPAPKTVVLDPGHGGRDNGTSAHEKTYALDVARRTKSLLESAGFKVVLTRSADTYVDLAQRAAIANASRADLFVSIHFNALPRDQKTSGIEVFTFAPKNQHAAEWWSLLRKDDPHLEKTDMPVNRFDHWNVLLAQSLQRRLVRDLQAFDRGRKLAHWGVLRPLTCPGVLVECGFLTSDAESRKIATPEHRQKIAVALAAGIRDYSAVLGATRGATPTARAKTSGSPTLRR